MRFITEMGDQKGYWLVVDTADNNAKVGFHMSATLAALDAAKREQEYREKNPSPQTQH